MRSSMNTGIAIGGPLDGQEISCGYETFHIPVKVGSDRGEGDRGFIPVTYKWSDGTWLMKKQYLRRLERMTREQFISAYAARSGLSDKWAILGFIEIGDRIQLAMPCDCGDDGCEGWAMIGPDSIDSHLKLYAPEPLRSVYRSAVERSQKSSVIMSRDDNLKDQIKFRKCFLCEQKELRGSRQGCFWNGRYICDKCYLTMKESEGSEKGE